MAVLGLWAGGLTLQRVCPSESPGQVGRACSWDQTVLSWVTPRGPHSRTPPLSHHRGLRFMNPGMALGGQELVCDDTQPWGGGTWPLVAVTLGLLQSPCAVTPLYGTWGDSRPSRGPVKEVGAGTLCSRLGPEQTAGETPHPKDVSKRMVVRV